jgi:hypothetical protein
MKLLGLGRLERLGQMRLERENPPAPYSENCDIFRDPRTMPPTEDGFGWQRNYEPSLVLSLWRGSLRFLLNASRIRLDKEASLLPVLP